MAQNLQGKGITSHMEVRELMDGRYAIMHTSNDAIICYGDGTKPHAEKTLRLLTASPKMFDALKKIIDTLSLGVPPNYKFDRISQIALEAISEAEPK
jgi:hypothetical protein